MAKLGHGLLSAHYSQPDMVTDEQKQKTSKGIKPTSFKSLVGRGHPGFSTKRRKDAHEFFVHVFDLIERSVHMEGSPVHKLAPSLR